jgi:hypothetical protein
MGDILPKSARSVASTPFYRLRAATERAPREIAREPGRHLKGMPRRRWILGIPATNLN